MNRQEWRRGQQPLYKSWGGFIICCLSIVAIFAIVVVMLVVR